MCLSSNNFSKFCLHFLPIYILTAKPHESYFSVTAMQLVRGKSQDRAYLFISFSPMKKQRSICEGVHWLPSLQHQYLE